VTAAPVRLEFVEKLPPIAVHVTPALSFVVAEIESPCPTVKLARWIETATVIAGGGVIFVELDPQPAIATTAARRQTSPVTLFK
jgi:hypothetical protein